MNHEKKPFFFFDLPTFFSTLATLSWSQHNSYHTIQSRQLENLDQNGVVTLEGEDEVERYNGDNVHPEHYWGDIVQGDFLVADDEPAFMRVRHKEGEEDIQYEDGVENMLH